MLYLVFNLGDEGYALPADRITEMLPFIAPKTIRGAPAIVAGSIGYRGRYLPIVDLAQLDTGHPAASRIGTRIVVTEVRVGSRMEKVGLVLEKATELLRCEPEAFEPFAPSPRGLVQLLDLDTLLPAHLFDGFFRELEPAR